MGVDYGAESYFPDLIHTTNHTAPASTIAIRENHGMQRFVAMISASSMFLFRVVFEAGAYLCAPPKAMFIAAFIGICQLRWLSARGRKDAAIRSNKHGRPSQISAFPIQPSSVRLAQKSILIWWFGELQGGRRSGLAESKQTVPHRVDTVAAT